MSEEEVASVAPALERYSRTVLGELRKRRVAFYAGWPNVFSALPVFKDVFEKRVK